MVKEVVLMSGERVREQELGEKRGGRSRKEKIEKEEEEGRKGRRRKRKRERGGGGIGERREGKGKEHEWRRDRLKNMHDTLPLV